MKKIMKPVIGLTLDSENPGSYATVPWYALRKNYCDALIDAGGVALPLPHDLNAVDAYVERIDGLVLTGGGFDVPPSLYGVDEIHETVTLKPERTDFEFAVAKACFKNGKPILGICGGMQLINVMFGGTLIQDIPSHYPKALPHKQKPPYNKGLHSIVIEEGSYLYKLAQDDLKTMDFSVDVNSVHHQAVDKLGRDLRISARAADGIIEGIEYTGNIFCLGVQWHPEYDVTTLDGKIFDAFINACKK